MHSSASIRVPSILSVTICIVMDSFRKITHATLWCSTSCDWNKAKYDTQHGLWLWDPEYHSFDNMAQSAKCPAELHRGDIRSSRRPLQPCADSLSCSRCLLQSCTDVSVAPKYNYPWSQISYHLESATITAGDFQDIWESLCIIWEYFAQHMGGQQVSGMTLQPRHRQPGCLVG